MKHVLTALSLILAPTPSVAQAECQLLGLLAEKVMVNRNNGVSMGEMMNVVDGQLSKSIIFIAHQMPSDTKPEDFGVSVRDLCEGDR